MHLDFTQEQDDLRDSVRAVLERECPPALPRAIVEGEGDATGLWAKVVGLDWPALTVPEDCGGIGYGFVELAVVVEEMGRAIAPGPLFPTVTQFAPVVREVGTPEQHKRFLGAVASGQLTGTLAVAEVDGRWETAAMTTEARADGDDWTLQGAKHFVVEPSAVDEIAVAARVGERVGVFVVPAADCTITALDGLDKTREIATVSLDGVRVGADRVLGTPGSAGGGLERALEESTVSMALEILGTCQAIFDINLAYAKEREQFDRPIGSFQVVKHKLADGLVALERARACCYFAAACIAEDDPRRPLAAAVAKAAAGDAQKYIAREGIQLLGGIGYTWEHDMQLYVKRAKSDEALFGTAGRHRERIARMVGDRRLDHHGPRWTLDGR